MPGTQNNTTDAAQWVDLYGDHLYRFALSRVRDATVSEDIVQEAFIAALKARKNFEGRSSEKTWLTGILKHKIYDHFRKASREKVNYGHDVAEDVADFSGQYFNPDGGYKTTPGDWARDPSKSLESKEFYDVFKKCLAGLPEKHSRSFVLKEVDGLKGKEICEVLGITPTNLWTMLYRARMKLRDCMEQKWLKSEKPEN